MELFPKRIESSLFYKGKDLLQYQGDRRNYKEVGRHLAKTIHTREERESLCFSPRKTNIKDPNVNRKPAPKSDVDVFKG